MQGLERSETWVFTQNYLNDLKDKKRRFREMKILKSHKRGFLIKIFEGLETKILERLKGQKHGFLTTLLEVLGRQET